jgi:hypothetical protein
MLFQVSTLEKPAGAHIKRIMKIALAQTLLVCQVISIQKIFLSISHLR